MSSPRSHFALASLLAFSLGLAPGVPPARAEDAAAKADSPEKKKQDWDVAEAGGAPSS